MKRTFGTSLLCMALLAFALALTGCGGSDGDAVATVDSAQLTVYWGPRYVVEPAASAPSSALSIEIIINGAAADGSNYQYVINRHGDSAPYTQIYDLPGPLRQGATTMALVCHADYDGQGDMVGIGAATVEISPQNAIVGDVSITGITSRLEVLPGQQVTVDEPKTLEVAVYDREGKILTVSPGSLFWTVTEGQDNLEFILGNATAHHRGEAKVVATCDGIASDPEPVHILGRARAILLGNAPGGSGSFANAVSADATTVVGSANMPDEIPQAFRWTDDTGIVLLGVLPGYDGSEAFGVSADGSVVVGSCQTNGDPFRRTAFRWTAAGGMEQLLGSPESADASQALGVSHDGNTIVGWTASPNGEEAFIWDNGMVTLLADFMPPDGFADSTATGVSADGSMVVGEARYDYDEQTGNPLMQAFRWDATSGLVPLGYLYDAMPTSGAFAVSADGRVVTGESGPRARGLSPEPFRWTPETGMVSLVPGGIGAGMSLSADGTFIVGVGTADPGGAITWHSDRGVKLLVGLMEEHDLELPEGFLPVSPSGVSADGRTIVGMAGKAGPTVQAYLIDLP